MTPRRVQRSRANGWRKPAGAVNVTRPSIWGNRFTGPDAVALFRAWLAEPEQAGLVARAKRELRGRDLM